MAWIPSVVTSDKGEETFWTNFDTREMTNTAPSDYTGGSLEAYKNQALKQLWDSTPGADLNTKIDNFARKYGGTSQMEQQLASFGITPQEFYSSGAGTAMLQARADRDFGDTVHQYALPAIMGLMGGAALYGAPAAAEGAAAGAYGGMDAAAVAGADYGAAAGGAAAGGSAMPAAIAEADPTFGGVLTQTSPGVYAAGGTPMMPAAIPETDPTFGGELTQTSAGGFENLGNTSEFGGGLAPAGLAGGGSLAATAASGGSSGGASGGGASGGGAGPGGGLFDLADDEWLRRLSYGIPGLLGAIGAGAQAEDFEDLSHQYQQMGAPYRSRLEQLYANPEAFLNSPEVRQPIQQGTDMLARSLSVKGNPAGSGNALQELQNYASTQLFNRLGQEKDRLGGFGGLTAYNQAAPQAASNALSAQGNIYSNLGGAAADIFNPPKRYTLQDLLNAKV